jgi:hypothetical protein
MNGTVIASDSINTILKVFKQAVLINFLYPIYVSLSYYK